MRKNFEKSTHFLENEKLIKQQRDQEILKAALKAKETSKA